MVRDCTRCYRFEERALVEQERGIVHIGIVNINEGDDEAHGYAEVRGLGWRPT